MIAYNIKRILAPMARLTHPVDWIALALAFLAVLTYFLHDRHSRKLEWDSDYAPSYKVYELVKGKRVFRGETNSPSFQIPDRGTHTYVVTSVVESASSKPFTVSPKK